MLILLFQACTSQLVHVEEGKQLLNPPAEPTEEGYFTDHFEIAEIIPIQTSEAFLVSDIKRVIRYQDKVILLSGKNNTVFVINADNGRIETHIHKIGKGPGEWRLILDIAFDEQSEQILIYNDYSKLLTFDLQGQFLSESNVDGLYENIHVYNEEVFFHNKLEGYSCYPYLIDVLNRKDNTWRVIGRDEKIDFPIRVSGRQMVKSKQLWFTAPLDFNLFSYDKEQIRTPYELAIPDAGLDENLINKATSNPMLFFGEVAKNNLIYSINSIRETSDYIVFHANQGGLFTINKKENEVHWDKSVEELSLHMKLTYYPHDGDDDKIMFILPAEAYTQHAKSNPGSSDNSLDVKEYDNPILIFYKQKSIVAI